MNILQRLVFSIFPLVMMFALAFTIGCNNNESTDKNGIPGENGSTIVINPDDDSCAPASSEFEDCAEACEVNTLGCATDILAHIQSDTFISRRVLYPGTTEKKVNIQTPMHGLFVPTWNNPQLNDAINTAIENPFAEIEMPPWSISAKLNDNPGTPGNDDPENLTWATVMYKIPGYCTERIFPFEDSPCKGGEWFWFLYRFGFLSFEFDSKDDSSLPVWGKAEDFCLDCHGAVADSDWLWITHDLIKRRKELERPLSNDGHTPGATGAAFCDDVKTLSPDRPEDVLFDPASLSGGEAQTMLDCYSWKTFIALSWPADEGMRGEPDITKNIADSGNRVWETYKQVYEVFQPLDPIWTLADKNWNDPQPLPKECIDALAEAGISTEGVLTFQLLNETHQAFGNQFNTLVDQNGNVAQYNVRINEDEFQYIKMRGFADTGAYSYNGPLNTGGFPVVLPDNTNGIKGEGTTEIKSAWKEMCTDPAKCNHVDNPERYYTNTALIYTPSLVKTIDAFNEQGSLPPATVTVPADCRVAQVGLTGLHVIAKTFWMPQWIWSTFEHIDNVPGNTTDMVDDGGQNSFSYFNPQCATPSLQSCLDQRPGVTPAGAEKNPDLICCENFQLISNSSPHQSNTAPLELIQSSPGDLISNQITRVDGIQESADELNKVFRSLLNLARSPLQNYVLVSTQWAADGRLSEDSENPFAINNKLCLKGDTEPCMTFVPIDLRLRNTVIETFQVSFCAPEDEDISNDAVNCTPENVGDDPHLSSSGGCMNCHFSSGTDFSFIWADAVEEVVPLQ